MEIKAKTNLEDSRLRPRMCRYKVTESHSLPPKQATLVRDSFGVASTGRVLFVDGISQGTLLLISESNCFLLYVYGDLPEFLDEIETQNSVNFLFVNGQDLR